MDSAFRARISELKGRFEYGQARAELDAIAEGKLTPEDHVWVEQQRALCTYKDEERPLTERLDEAERILEGIALREPRNPDGETLALGGAVYKRRWETAGHLEHLHEALAFYRAGWERGTPDDKRVYAGVNAVFLLEVLASRARGIARRTGTDPGVANAHAQEAGEIRCQALGLAEGLLSRDPSLTEDFWHYVSLGELYLGHGRTDPIAYDRAETAFRHAAAVKDASDWQLQTTFLQAKALLRAQGVEPPSEVDRVPDLAPAWRAVAALLRDDSATLALASRRGKVGLALSGGGFRASLFHLGVLARLADVDALRSVEVISTVSGGSIVGAHYYLEIQALLADKADPVLRRQDYVELVRRVQRHFFAGVQKNIRMRALGNLVVNLKVTFDSRYTYSRRLGELYERFLYASVKDGKGTSPRRMSDLLIAPMGAAPGFKPKFSNWRRRAKVPVVLLNATSLNSGHNWQFTARSMGEPPGRLNTDVDANLRYRRLWYGDAPESELEHFRLGYAVAASACVPGLFEPIVLEGLYDGRTVRLVDGGVHDNQGVAGLLDEGCALMLVSDASGQMDDLANPANDRLGVPLRSNSILMDRVREAEFEDLQSRVDSHALQGLLFVHLKQGLAVEPLTWKPKPGTTAPGLPARRTGPVPTATAYDIDKDLQRLLASIRTDLDSFTEVEAHALMLSGYLMTEQRLKELDAEHRATDMPGQWGDFDIHAPRGNWPFLELAATMQKDAGSGDPRRDEIARQLCIGGSIVFKAWRLSPFLRVLSYVLGAAAVTSIACALWRHWHQDIHLTVGGIALPILLFLLTLQLPLARWVTPQSVVRERLIKLAVAFLAFALTWLHLLFVEPFFLRAGRLERLLKKRRSQRVSQQRS